MCQSYEIRTRSLPLLAATTSCQHISINVSLSNLELKSLHQTPLIKRPPVRLWIMDGNGARILFLVPSRYFCPIPHTSPHLRGNFLPLPPSHRIYTGIHPTSLFPKNPKGITIYIYIYKESKGKKIFNKVELCFL